MKQYKEVLLVLGAMFALSSCSDQNAISEYAGDPMSIESIHAKMGTMQIGGGIQTRKIDDFSVNTPLDPTASMQFRTNWELDVQIYKAENAYPGGQSTFQWDQLAGVWLPDNPIFFPNYSKQLVSAKLTSPTWQNDIYDDQHTETLLLEQDVLEQNGDGTVTINPAHIPIIEMRHGHSMLDFILDGVDESHIADLKVYVGSKTYTPYRVNTTSQIEYLLILPVGSQKPEIRLTTVEGAKYTERVQIMNTKENVAYCIHLKGIELSLATITVADWTLGKALSGNYSSTTSYPTFQGAPDATYTLYYDNDLKQDITFNTNGERTIKPAGRTLIKVQSGSKFVDLHIVLRSMVIDLEPYFVE